LKGRAKFMPPLRGENQQQFSLLKIAFLGGTPEACVPS
jgi:hypothetical protein